jgi:hypothetical protein
MERQPDDGLHDHVLRIGERVVFGVKDRRLEEMQRVPR